MALIPSIRLIGWVPGTDNGIPGGVAAAIATHPTIGTGESGGTLTDMVGTYGADCDQVPGIDTWAEAIQAEVDAFNGVYFESGTYQVNAAITLPIGYSHRSIRGEDPLDTILVGANFVAVGDDWNQPGTAQGEVVTAGLTLGSTSITVADASNIAVNKLMRISFDPNQQDETAIESGAIPVIARGGTSEPLRHQVVMVTGKAGNVVSFAPALQRAPDAGIGATVWSALKRTTRVGFESFSITDTGGAAAISLTHADDCWVSDVVIQRVPNRGIHLTNCLRIEVRHSDILERTAGGSNGAAVLMDTCANCLIEDNIFVNVEPTQEVNSGSSGNATLYNLHEKVPINAAIGGCIDTNHGPHNYFNLYEGNITSNVVCDGYFGGASEDTIHRNWIHGVYFGDWLPGYSVALKRFTRDYNLTGNIIGKDGIAQGSLSLGEPNLGNSTFVGTAQPSLGDYWADWPGGTGDGGYQELDLDVEATLIDKGNYVYGANGAAGSMSSLGGDPLPDSFAYAAKPDWWDTDHGTMAWPPFDPTDPDAASYDNIPAGRRYQARYLQATAPTITSANSATAYVGVPFSFQITANGNPDPTRFHQFANGESATLGDKGLSMSAAGLITGTPSSTGALSLILVVLNNRGYDQMLDFDLAIAEAHTATLTCLTPGLASAPESVGDFVFSSVNLGSN